jgi:hypothetical protein
VCFLALAQILAQDKTVVKREKGGTIPFLEYKTLSVTSVLLIDLFSNPFFSHSGTKVVNLPQKTFVPFASLREIVRPFGCGTAALGPLQ